MKSLLQRFGKEFLLVGIGQVIFTLGSILGVRLMTGALAPAVYGQVSLAITFVTLISQILVIPLSASLSRYFNLAREQGRLPAFLGSGFLLAVRINLASLGLFGAGAAGLWLLGQSGQLGLAVCTCLFSIFSGINILMDSTQSAARQRAVVAWHQGVGQWVRYLAAVGCVYLLGRSASSAMAGYAASAVLILASQLFFFRRRFQDIAPAEIRPDPDWTRRILDYSLPFASWGIFTWLQMTSDRWALQTFSSTQDVGFYTVLYQLGYYPLMILSYIFTQFAQPVLFSQAGDGSQSERVGRAQRNTWRILAGFGLLTGLGVAAAAWLHPLVFQLLAAPGYRSVSPYLPWMVLASGLFGCGQIAAIVILNRGDSQALRAPKILTGIVGTAFNLAGAYFLGLPGVVYGMVAFSGLYLAWILLLRRPRP